MEHAPHVQPQRVLRAAASADGSLADAPSAPAALLLLRDIAALTSSASDLPATSAQSSRTHANFSAGRGEQRPLLSLESWLCAQELSSAILCATVSRSFTRDEFWTGIKASLVGF